MHREIIALDLDGISLRIKETMRGRTGAAEFSGGLVADFIGETVAQTVVQIQTCFSLSVSKISPSWRLGLRSFFFLKCQ